MSDWEDHDWDNDLEYQQRLAASVRLDKASKKRAQERVRIMLMERRLQELEEEEKRKARR